MSPKTMLRSLMLLLAAFSLFSIRLAAQDDAPSVADAARRARQQKQDAAKPAHVIDNDAIPPSPSASGLSSDSNAPAPADNTSASPAAAKPEANPADQAKKNEETEALKKEIADKKEKINFQQREIALAQDTYYSNPDREHDTAGKDKLNSMQADLTQAQAELADLQAKLAAAEPPGDEKPVEPAKLQP
jgi:hypothetical protein